MKVSFDLENQDATAASASSVPDCSATDATIQEEGEKDVSDIANVNVALSPKPLAPQHDADARDAKANDHDDDDDDDDFDDTPFDSHFSLRIPTSTVHFRGQMLCVIDTEEDQILIQETSHRSRKKRFLVKHLSPNTPGHYLLRLSYTLLSILFLGFLFVFCFQVLLFLFIALPVDSSYNSQTLDFRLLPLVSTLLGFPVMVYGMSSLMAMGAAFVVDTWRGGVLFRSTPAEVAYAVVFLVLPLATLAVALLARAEAPWRLAAGTWAVSVALLFGVFGCAVTWRMVGACFWLVERYFQRLDERVEEREEKDKDTSDIGNGNANICGNIDGNGNGNIDDNHTTPKRPQSQHIPRYESKRQFSTRHCDSPSPSDTPTTPPPTPLLRLPPTFHRYRELADRALLLTQTARYSGTRHERYRVSGADVLDDFDGGGLALHPDYSPLETRTDLYSRFTALSCLATLRAFETLDPPRRIYQWEELREITPFLTRFNYSMQKMWGRGIDGRRRTVVVARGPSGLTATQMRFAGVCSVTGTVLVTLCFIGGLVWMATGPGSYVIVALVSLVCCVVPLVRSNREMYSMYRSLNEEEVPTGDRDERQGDDNVFHVWETVRITRPKAWYCYTRVAIEIVFFFLWPFVAMLGKKNYPVAFIFFMLSSFTFLWRYFDASAVLSELGSLSKVTSGEDGLDESEEDHKLKHRLSEIVGRVYNSRGREVWTVVFAVFGLAIAVLFLSARGNSENITPDQRALRPPILLVNDFYYPPLEGTIAYPTCKLNKGFSFPGVGSSDLADYSFLSALAYERSNVTTVVMEKWFGAPDVVIDGEEFVTQFRIDSNTQSSPVYFKLFSFPSAPGVGVMSIRGSETAYDWIVNMQLWSSSGLAQLVKWITPYGWIWNPIIPDFIRWVNFAQSPSIRNVAYYKVTTRFVNDVLAGYGGNLYDTIRITGASLGGGLAIITGAQTDAFTVAISGLGATLGRKAFYPPIDEEKLNTQTFNFIPERDYIARIGGRAPFFQNGECTAPKNNLFGCHSMWRSLCEIQYKCGTYGRPVPCRCVEQFGYPLPERNGTRSFEQACQEEEAAWNELFSL